MSAEMNTHGAETFPPVDKQNELEIPSPTPKSRDRKRRQQQQLMTQISGVRKVPQGPGLSGSCSTARFGVKTDLEDLLSKVQSYITDHQLHGNRALLSSL